LIGLSSRCGDASFGAPHSIRETMMAEDRKAALQKALSRRAELAARINQSSTSLSTEEWDEFFALAEQLNKLGHLKPEAVDDGPTP
jgi:hypothetical protein